ncbi:MAG: glycosyltransferase [Bacillota bacterium]
MLPKVTIGIPFFNNELTLIFAVKSVFAQSYQNWELILIDDGSSDNSLSIINSINDKRIKIISDGMNKGLPSRLNQISFLASGKYIARMDADDMMHPHRLEKQVYYLEANPQIDIVSTAAYSIDEKNVPFGKRGNRKFKIDPYNIMNNKVIFHPTVTGRIEWFINNLYNESYKRSQDLELWCRSYKNFSYAKLDEPLHFYREINNFNIKKYLENCYFNRLIYQKYGPVLIGKKDTLILTIKSYLKGGIYKLSTLFYLQNLLIKRRNTFLNTKEKDEALQILEKVLSTAIPL